MAARLWEFKSPLGHYAPVLQERICFCFAQDKFVASHGARAQIQ